MLVVPSTTHAPARAAHSVQLFDSDESLAESVADYFADGLIRRDRMLAVIDGERWNSVAMQLSARGLPIEEALRFGHLVVCDSLQVLNRLMRRNRPDPGLFAATVGTLVEGLAAFGKPLRIYSETVDILAARGDYTAAAELEDLWNGLGRRQTLTLFCGYSSAHFGDPRNAGALRRICASHSEVRANPRDVLGTFLLRAHQTG